MLRREPTSLYHSALLALCVFATSPTSFEIAATIFLWSLLCLAELSCARRSLTSCVAVRRVRIKVRIKATKSRCWDHCHYVQVGV